MFMFRSKRNILSKRLVEAHRRRAQQLGSDECVEVGPLLKRLQENQLQMLLSAVTSRGQGASNCVLLPRDNQPHVLCCQAWRWPDLRLASELRRLPVCRSAADPVYICCNPYHWSRICQPDYPPPPYSVCAMDTLKPEDRAPSEAPLVCRNSTPGSLTTSGEGSLTNTLSWCKLAYWEMGQRVGPLYPVEQPAVNVFGQVPYGDGLSLETLARHSFSPPDSVTRTRDKIGLGVTISHEGDSVWVYNRSDSPIFVNSLSLDDFDSASPTRVPADYCLCIFDPIRVSRNNNDWNFKRTQHFGPIDKNSIRLSFVKGWGPRYSRQEITSCPCWLEILLSPCR
ncbi:mothers against decapentaplegic homolog 6 isoform X2 [Harmonia axyridis]|uniref:mothers against decapentaplegic homolog 6 isoform X2 n=1 Tax=Harmonia axyridis TaxID=115357 RepID=UPI001E275B54|nr:mothers against decapentaplegic homolog 6 isoform X2 [Harmonia axyridis]